jgi:hypothetical protein
MSVTLGTSSGSGNLNVSPSRLDPRREVPAHLILHGDRVTLSITSRAESYTSVVGRRLPDVRADRGRARRGPGMLCPAITATVSCFLPESSAIETRNVKLGRPGGSVQLQGAVKTVLTAAAQHVLHRLVGLNEVQRSQCRHIASRGLIRSRANSNNDLSRAQFVPNPRNNGHSRLIMVSLFLCM